ncbi:hypothetical protein COOONC_05110, partial [Cooperia oncophora]
LRQCIRDIQIARRTKTHRQEKRSSAHVENVFVYNSKTVYWHDIAQKHVAVFGLRDVFQCRARSTVGAKKNVGLRRLLDKDKKLKKFWSRVERKVVFSGNKNSFFKFLRARLKPSRKLGVIIDELLAIRRRRSYLANIFDKVFVVRESSYEEAAVSPAFPVMNDSLWFLSRDICKVLTSWPRSFSDTPDHIPLYFIKKIAPVISEPLAFILNLSLMRAEVPDRWRMSFVTPIPKKPPHSSPHNYRPISLTSIFASYTIPIRSLDDAVVLQAAIDEVFRWSTRWNLPLAKDKTKVLGIGQAAIETDYFIDGVKLE